MNSADIKQKYNNASTGLFKDNSSGDIGANDARALVVDMADNFLNYQTDIEKYVRQGTASGTDAYTVTLSSPTTTYADMNLFVIDFTNAATGLSSLNVNGGGVRKIYSNPSTQATIGDIEVGAYLLRFQTALDSGIGGFLMISGGTSSGGGPGITDFASITGEPYDNTELAGEFRKTRTVTTGDTILQTDDNSLIIFNSASPITFVLEELTASTKASFINVGSADVTFGSGAGVTITGNLTLGASAGTSYPTALVFYHTSTTPRTVVGGAGGGTGDVQGPASSVDNAIVLFDGATGKIIQDSTILIDGGDLETGDGGNIPTKDAVLNHIATSTDLTDFVTLTDAAPVQVDCNLVKEPKFYLETGSSRTLNITELRANNTLNNYTTILFCIKKTVAGDITITFDGDYTNFDISSDAALPAINLSGADEKRFWITGVVRGLASGCDIAWNLVTTAGGGGGGSGDVVGPAAATDGAPVLFDGTTGKLIKNSTPTGTGNPVLHTSPTFATLITTPLIKITGGSPGSGKVLTSDADGDATWQTPSGGGGSGAWGGITGTMSDQTDLQTALDAKQPFPAITSVTPSSNIITLNWVSTAQYRKFVSSATLTANTLITFSNDTNLQQGELLVAITGTIALTFDTDVRFPDDTPGLSYPAGVPTISVITGGTALVYRITFDRLSGSYVLGALSSKTTL